MDYNQCKVVWEQRAVTWMLQEGRFKMLGILNLPSYSYCCVTWIGLVRFLFSSQRYSLNESGELGGAEQCSGGFKTGKRKPFTCGKTPNIQWILISCCNGWWVLLIKSKVSWGVRSYFENICQWTTAELHLQMGFGHTAAKWFRLWSVPRLFVPFMIMCSAAKVISIKYLWTVGEKFKNSSACCSYTFYKDFWQTWHVHLFSPSPAISKIPTLLPAKCCMFHMIAFRTL